MSINRGMDKEDVVCVPTHKHTHIDTMENYSTIEKNEIIPFVAIWMYIEIIIPSQVSPTEKDKYHIISLICEI